MAGNIVKWWKHKILGGYKQFSVQECTTDSEELMYHQVRASSSCSAPPDLLLVSERDNNIQLRSPVVNIITTPPGNASGTAGHKQLQQQGHQHHQALPHTHASRHHHQHPMQLPQDMSSSGSHTKHLRISSSSAGGKHGKYANVQQQTVPTGVDEDVVDAAAASAAAQPSAQQQQQHSRHLHHHKEERIRLEEFTCDVSVEGGKSSQPLQFSFTFYDLDGHHGKITKDDIVGIVYTIYESIGKSVVVPHCGSKTINVRLTVSPEGKSKSAPQPLPAAAFGGGNNNNSSSNNNKLKKLPMGLAAAMAKQVNGGSGGGALTTSAGTRRQHRYRPRKLIKSDDEDDDSNSDKEKDALAASADRADQQPSGSGGTKGAGGSKSHHHHHHGRYQQKSSSKVEQCCVGAAAELQQTPDNTYENMLNLKQEQQPQQPQQPSNDVADCPSHRQSHHQRQQDIYMKQATQRVKMLRRARKQKYQDHCMETRQRSLSVGNDWQQRHLPQSQQPQAANKSASVSPPPPSGGELMLDGVQLRQPRHHQSQTQSHHQQQQQRKSAECWKSALNRNDLISIIRESMEKNRLCFQLNGKPQANVSPIRQPAAQQQQQQQQRQRSSTGSKIPTLIANHSPAAQSPVSCSPTCSHPAAATCNIPAASAAQAQAQAQAQAAIEQGGAGHHHDHPQPHIPIYHQQLAINPAVLAAQHSHNSAHNKLNLCGYDSFLHATICGGGSAAHSPPPTTTTTPSNVATVQPIPKKSHNQKSLLQGYQRLEQQQQQQQQQRSSKDYKNYGNLIYAKLSEQLQQKEREQRRHRHKQQHQQQQLQQSQLQQQQQPLKPKEESLPEQQREQQQQRPPTSSSSSTGSKIFGDALECAHLLASEEEDLPASPPLTSTPSKVVSTDTLIDLNDDVGEAVAEAVTEGGKALEADEDDSHQEVELDTSASSSMIHRYVHEHIHHHYHHFKEQQDV